MRNHSVKNLKDVLLEGIRSGVFPGCVLVVGSSKRVLFEMHAGHACIEPEKVEMAKDTIFDLASLTKPLATAIAIMRLVNDGHVELGQDLSELLEGVVPDDKKGITIIQLLSHCAGLPDWRPFYEAFRSNTHDYAKNTIRKLVLEMSLEYEPGTKAVYSDLGYMLLEWIVERVSGLPLVELVDKQFYEPLGLRRTFFQPTDEELRFSIKDYAATERCPWRRRVIRGYVHDENAHVMGGYSGHAGLFSTAMEVYSLCKCLLQHYYEKRSDLLDTRLVQQFFKKQDEPRGTTWALGWDTPSPKGSSAGRLFSHNSVGHLGFTGTSVWMDLDRDLIVVFLTNRIHPSRANEKIKDFRPRLHDAVLTWYEGGKVRFSGR